MEQIDSDESGSMLQYYNVQHNIDMINAPKPSGIKKILFVLSNTLLK